MKHIQLLVCCLLFSACATTEVQPHKVLLGHWVGWRDYLGDRLQWIIERKSDGTYRLEFQRCRKGHLVWSHTELGNWRVEGDYYHTITRLLLDKAGVHRPNTPKHTYSDAYLILDLDEDEFDYRHSLKSVDFETVKVDRDFKLSCKP